MDCWTTVLLVILVYKFMDWFVRQFYIGRYDKRYILVTGCDMGFGNDIAKRLDALGCHVFAGCLTEAGETDLKKTCSNRLHPISMDVSKPEHVRRAFDTVKGLLPHGAGLWGILNNAGILGAAGIMEAFSIDDYKKTASINLYGLIDVTMTFLPLVKACGGRVVNTSSVIGRLTISLSVPYCVTKYGVESFTDGLRRTLYPFNCKAILIEPGMHVTNFGSRENFEGSIASVWNKADPVVKEEYGEEYFQHTPPQIFFASEDQKISDDVTVSAVGHLDGIHEGLDPLYKIATYTTAEVVHAYEHALLGRFPRARYLVGRDAKFVYLPLQWLPEWLGDWVIRQIDPKCPLPAALKKSH